MFDEVLATRVTSRVNLVYGERLYGMYSICYDTYFYAISNNNNLFCRQR